ncbi:hypothetical protein AB5J49_36260 [Streptomyces sp. R28]|uniref:Uncharacterized protein n=1 Tax=Streptomyces sp. R28 TaxID=3238628 RepID=A0AB39Q7T6_9ACTN
MRLKLPSRILKSRDPYNEPANLDDRMNPMLRLEVIDATLGCVQQALQGAHWQHRQKALSYARQLEGILREGDSAFTVAPGEFADAPGQAPGAEGIELLPHPVQDSLPHPDSDFSQGTDLLPDEFELRAQRDGGTAGMDGDGMAGFWPC